MSQEMQTIYTVARSSMPCGSDSTEAVQEAHEGYSKQRELRADIAQEGSRKREENSDKKSKGRAKERNKLYERRGVYGRIGGGVCRLAKGLLGSKRREMEDGSGWGNDAGQGLSRSDQLL